MQTSCQCSVSRWAFLIVPLAGLMMNGPLSAAEKKTAKKKAAAKTEKITYEKHIKPIFRQKCFGCHNADKKKSGLDLTNFTNLLQGGSSGEVIEPGSSADSYLYMLVSHESEPHMPPKSEKLPAPVLAVIAKWIDGGALENDGSKSFTRKKPKFDFALKGAPTGKPDGPPPMPRRLSLEPVVRTKMTTAVAALATSPWAPLVAVGGQKQVLLYHSESLELIGVLPFPEGVPQVLKFSSNGTLLLAGGGQAAAKGRVVVWSVTTGERIFEVGDELDSVLAADISADQTLIALGGPNRVVRIYSTETGELLHELRKHTNWIYSIAFSPDGVLLATGDRNGGIFVWESHTGREYLSLRGHGGGITGLSWRSDSNVLASCSEDTRIRIWEMENGGNIKNWGAHGGGTSSVEFTRDGRLVSCGRDRVAKLWDQNGKQLRAFPAFGDIALRVTHCDETNRVVAGDWSGAIRVWNAADGKQLGALTMNPVGLAQRLRAATALVPSREAEAKKLTDTSNAAQAASAKTKGELDAANKNLASSQKQIDTATATAKTSKAAIVKLTAESQALTKSITALEPVVALLKDSSDKAQQAVKKSPADKELANAASAIKAQFDGKSGKLATDKKTLTEKATALGISKQQLAAAEKQSKEGKTAYDASKKQVDTLTPVLKAATAKATAAKQASATASQLLAVSKTALARWQDEINFDKQFKELSAHRAQSDQLTALMQTEKAELDEAQSKSNTAQQAARNAQKQSDAAAAGVKAAQATLTKSMGDETAAAKLVSNFEAAVPLLKESQAKAQQAAEKLAGDKDLAAASASLKTLVEKKSAALEAARKDQAQKKTAIGTAKGQLAAAQKKAGDMTAALQVAQKKAAEASAAVKPFEEKFAAAKKTAETAKREVERREALLYPSAAQASVQ